MDMQLDAGTSQIQRPRYFEGQYLGAGDLTAAVEYGRVMHARHALGAHTWGIAAGLEIAEMPRPGGGGIDVYILPGVAWDGFGRMIVVPEPERLPADLFASISYLPSDAPGAGNPDGGRLVPVWLRYDELPAGSMPAGFEQCDGDEGGSRLQETFRIEVGTRLQHADQHSVVEVAGQQADALVVPGLFDPDHPSRVVPDESIPYQVFPQAGLRDRWLVPLGQVRWMPPPTSLDAGAFIARSDGDKNDSAAIRRYLGAVASEVAAPGGVIRLRERYTAYSTTPSSDLVWVEGSLRAGGDVRMFGTRLSFVNSIGQDDEAPLRLQRAESRSTGTGKALQIVTGAAEAGANALEIGPAIAPSGGGDPVFTPQVYILDNGKIGIGTDSPVESLHIASADPDLSLDIAADSPFHYAELRFKLDNVTKSSLFWSRDDSKTYLTNAGQQAIVVDGGNVGIGTAAPNVRLEVNGAVRGNQNGALRIDTGSGYVDVGSQNSDWAHFYTDRTKYYFNKEVRVDSGRIGSYNEDLLLCTGGVTRMSVDQGTGYVGINTTGPAEQLDVRGFIKLGLAGDLFAVGSPDRLRLIAGRVSDIGSVSGGSGFTASQTANGQYQVNFNIPFTSTPIVVATAIDSPFDDNIITVRNVSTGLFRVSFWDPDDEIYQNTAFSFIAIGSV